MVRIFTTILCVLLLVCAASAGSPVDAAGSGTLRTATSASGSPFAEVGEAGDVADASFAGEQPSWMGSVVLIFGGLLGALWLFAGLLWVLRGLGEARPRPESDELPPYTNRIRNDEAPPTDWL